MLNEIQSISNKESMRKSMLIQFVLIMLIVTSCNDTPSMDGSSDQEVFINARIYTVDDNKPWAEAMIIENGLITHIGTRAEIDSQINENTIIKDLGGKFVMPGIHDVHMHPLEASSSNFDFTINDEILDAEEYYDEIKAANDAKSGSGWLLGWGHYIHTVLEADRNPKEILDDISTTRPIAIMEQTSHSFWVNSKALEMTGITALSEDPEGGVIMRDEDGQPTGVLVDNAGNVLLDMVLTATPEREQKDYDGMVNFGFQELAKYGITSVCDARTYWKRNHHKTWKRLADDEALTARMSLGIWIYPTEEDNTQIATIKSLYESDDSDLLRSNQVKVYIDGIIPNTTAAIHGDYKIDLFGGATNNGVNYVTQERLELYIRELEPIGYDFHIHAIGDRGIHEALNAIENAGSSSGRHRITHCEFVDPADYPRFENLNVTADCQVAGDFTNPDHWSENHDFIEETLAQNIVPIKSLSANGARLTLSSDWDVSTLNPFVGMQNAVTRVPQEISIGDAIKAYTINAAYVMRHEDKLGSLEVGKEADFIVLSQNIMEVDPNTISGTTVVDTYLQGEKVN